MSIKRKLTALGYPEDINVADEKQLKKLVVSLEEEKIRSLPEKERKELANSDGSKFAENLQKYLKALNCPTAETNACLDWLLAHAVKISYTKNRDKFNKFAVGNLKNSNVPNVVADNPLDHLDFTSKEFRDEINKLSATLKVPSHPDPAVALESCSKIVQKHLNSSYVPMVYGKEELGLNPEAFDEPAKLLRLLYIQDLRNLQTKANECIVAIQSITANPKTDTRLGKVGK